LVVLAVRKGNPLAIHDWSDLVRPGLRVVTPDPASSGGGMWNVCAIYGAALRGHAGVAAGDPRVALDFLTRVLANATDRRKSAAESYESFRDGVGDVAITYESEVARGWAFGHDEERVIPRSTLLIENPAVLVRKNADKHGVRAAAEALLRSLWSVESQTRLAFAGLRPVLPDLAAEAARRSPAPQDLWTIDALGGWERAVREILLPAGLGASAARPSK
jgi:sulfate/thiosulfate transport system substrate-binding protein